MMRRESMIKIHETINNYGRPNILHRSLEDRQMTKSERDRESEKYENVSQIRRMKTMSLF